MNTCACNAKKISPSLTFYKCQRGYILREGEGYDRVFPTTYAFDRIEDLAAFLVEQFKSQEAPASAEQAAGE